MATSDDSASSQCGLGMKIILSTIRRKFSEVKQLSTETLAEWIVQSKGDNPHTDQRNLVILDTRAEQEYVISHLPGALRVDPDAEDVSSVLNSVVENTGDSVKGRPPCMTVVCYCSLGYRSSNIAQKIQHYMNTNPEAVQIVDVYNLEGSLFKWANEGRAMVDCQDVPTIYAHPFNSVWGKLLDKSLRRDKPP